MEDGQKSKTCKNCGYFDRYYIKSLHCFKCLKEGQCNFKNEAVSVENGCEHWLKNYRRFGRKRAASRALYEILMDLSAIRQILAEDKEQE